METKIQKWGNSLAVRLPQKIARKLSFYAGTSVSLVEKNNSLTVKESPRRNKTSLKELVGKIDKKNIHKGTDWGSVHGKEVW